MMSEFVHTHVHNATGRKYRVLGPAKMQCTDPVTDLQQLVLYEDDKGNRWVRPPHEFNDGRFTPVSTVDKIAASAKLGDRDGKDAALPTGGTEGQILARQAGNTAGWVDPRGPRPTSTKHG